MELCDEIWCVIECSVDGAAFEPEFFKSEQAAKDCIKRDAEECMETYSDYQDFQIAFDPEGMVALVGNKDMSWTWQGFKVTSKIENLCEE